MRLAAQDDALVLIVQDDGVGIDDSGVGPLFMREHAAALGGRAEVTCPPDGAHIVRDWLVAPLVALDGIEAVDTASDGQDADDVRGRRHDPRNPLRGNGVSSVYATLHAAGRAAAMAKARGAALGSPA